MNDHFEFRVSDYGSEFCNVSKVEKAGACYRVDVCVEVHGLIKINSQVSDVGTDILSEGPNRVQHPKHNLFWSHDEHLCFGFV